MPARTNCSGSSLWRVWPQRCMVLRSTRKLCRRARPLTPALKSRPISNLKAGCGRSSGTTSSNSAPSYTCSDGAAPSWRYTLKIGLPLSVPRTGCKTRSRIWTGFFSFTFCRCDHAEKEPAPFFHSKRSQTPGTPLASEFNSKSRSY